MARQGGQVQLEQSDMSLAFRMAKMANGGFSSAASAEPHYLITTRCAEVQEEKKRVVEILGHRKVKAAIERHLAILCRNHNDRWLPCHNGTAKHPTTPWRRRRLGAPPLDGH